MTAVLIKMVLPLDESANCKIEQWFANSHAFGPDSRLIRLHVGHACRFQEKRLSVLSWFLAVAGGMAVFYAISRDVPHARFQVAWSCVGWLFLFVTAARATFVAQFYRVFAEHLKSE